MGSQDPGIYAPSPHTVTPENSGSGAHMYDANTRIWGLRSRNAWYPTAQGGSNVRTRVGVGMDG
jgi:hypothetical protein